jgi:transcription antitermination factor NusG
VEKDLPSKDGEAMSEILLTSNIYQAGAVVATGDSPPQWFAAYTTPRHEKHVAEMLAERNIESFLPLYRTVRQWKKSSPVTLEMPLFPCYLFVHIRRAARGTVLGLPGVVSIVGSAKEPWPLPELEIEALQLGVQTGKVEPHPYLNVGDKVRIKAGSMAGVEGILVHRRNQMRFVLTLDAIMRSVSVEVDADDLEPVEESSGTAGCLATQVAL